MSILKYDIFKFSSEGNDNPSISHAFDGKSRLSVDFSLAIDHLIRNIWKCDHDHPSLDINFKASTEARKEQIPYTFDDVLGTVTNCSRFYRESVDMGTESITAVDNRRYQSTGGEFIYKDPISLGINMEDKCTITRGGEFEAELDLQKLKGVRQSLESPNPVFPSIAPCDTHQAGIGQLATLPNLVSMLSGEPIDSLHIYRSDNGNFRVLMSGKEHKFIFLPGKDYYSLYMETVNGFQEVAKLSAIGMQPLIHSFLSGIHIFNMYRWGSEREKLRQE